MLRPQLSPPVPEATARAAHAIFRKGHRYLTLRDELGTIFDDQLFAGLFPKVGQPAEAPWRLALVTLVQFAEGLSDREAADAARERLSFKYLLGLEIEDPGFDYSILSRFRERLIAGQAEALLLDTLIDRCQELGLLRSRGKARTDATQVLANVKLLNRLELVGETLRAALNALAVVATEWLGKVAEPEWYGRYSLRIENRYLPQEDNERDAAIQQIGLDGYKLLIAVYEEGPAWLAEVPAVEMLRRIWVQQYWLERVETGETWDYSKGKPRKTYLYVCKLGDRELYRDTNPAFAGAVKKGYEAAANGAAKGTNPYNAFDSCRGGATFARAFHKYWNLGYDSHSERSKT